MFLRRVQIENFRGIERLDLRLDDTTLLIGENDSGKTSLLDTLEICLGVQAEGESFSILPTDFRCDGDGEGASACPMRVVLTFRERKNDNWSGYESSPLAQVMHTDDGGRRGLRFEMVARPENGTREPEVRWSFGESGPDRTSSDGELLRELRRLNPFLLLRSDRFAEEDVAVPSPAPRVDSGTSGGAQRELEEQVERLYHDLFTARGPLPAEQLQEGLDAVARLIRDVADRIPADAERPRLLRDLVQTPWGGRRRDLRGLVPGAGMQSIGLVVLFGAFLEARGERTLAVDARPIVAIEEPEAHLHPHLLAAVWRVIEGFPAQKLITTNSGELLAAAPLRSLRRLQRRDGEIGVFRPGRLTTDELRRIAYHIRVKRGGVFFARCWLLVEGETEFWLIPELARLCGFDLRAEGVRLVEFAQSGVEPLVKLANDLGIEWYVLVDGDSAGDWYIETVRAHLGSRTEQERILRLEDPDVELCLWNHGYAGVYRRIAVGGATSKQKRPARSRERPRTVIDRAIRMSSKPTLALSVLEAASAPDSPGVPPILRTLIDRVVKLARG